MTSQSKATLAAVTASLLATFAAMNLFRAAKSVTDDYRIEERSQRYAALPGALPAQVREVGYLTDSPYGSSTGGQLLFFTAQYSLAPRLLRDRADMEWVVGNFREPKDWAHVAAEKGLRVERDLGNGLVVFRRAKP